MHVNAEWAEASSILRTFAGSPWGIMMKFFRKITSLAAVFAALFSAGAAQAQTDMYIRGSGRLFPIALPQLCTERGDFKPAKQIPETIARDLDVSGYFKVINPGAYIETPGKCGEFAYSDWSVTGAEGLVRGVVVNEGGQLKIQMYLHDVAKQRIVLGKEYQGDLSQAVRIAHRFANDIMKYFTGESGVFGTQIAFSSRVGRFKDLWVMDMDGSGLRQLTDDRSLGISPNWTRDGNGLYYTSYRRRVPDLFRLDLATRKVSQITNTRDLELGARPSPDGSLLLGSISSGKESDIVLFAPDGRLVRKLTGANGAIDVSPDWSPDGRKVVFCSNRGGGPQIYTMDTAGAGLQRVSFVSSSYCTSPAWSPKGDKIAFVCRGDGGFQLFTANPDGTNPLQLTAGGDNEDPSWSPDGRYIAFATTFWGGQFSIAVMRADGRSMKQVSHSRGGDYQPVWGPRLP